VKFLVTNDDGIEAPGLAALERAAHAFGELLVLAPASPLSGCSHQATTHQFLEITRDDDGRQRLDGTPVDCVRVGLTWLAPDIDCVLSGINDGGNLGVDVYMSGTVAAVREAALLGKRGLAISHFHRPRVPIDWDRAVRWADLVLRMFLARDVPQGAFWNVNFPAEAVGKMVPEIVFRPLDPNPLPVHYRAEGGKLMYQGDYQSRSRQPGHDVEACFGGQITVTEISLPPASGR
jgi:5'-nucleotidase